MGYGLAATTAALATFGLTWLAQSTVLLALGLLAGRLLRSSGPAVQSTVYRTALATVLACPIASALLAWTGHDGFALRLPSPASEDGPAPATPARVAPPSRPMTAGARVRWRED